MGGVLGRKQSSWHPAFGGCAGLVGRRARRRASSEGTLGATRKAVAFVPVHKSEVPKTSKVFHYTWVDKQRDGVHKSRFTCADIKRKYTSAEEAEMRVFVPTPTPESHALLEVSALKHGHAMRTFDIVAAFLIGQDRGAQQGEPVYMRAPPEWRPLFDAWVSEQQWNPETMEEVRAAFSEYMFRLEGNVYGRRTAGAVYRDEFEEILCTKLQPEFEFKRGVRDPFVYRCDMEELSFQDLLLPLRHIEHTLCRLRDLLWHINSIADILETPSAEAMRKASGQVTAAINHHERLKLL